MSKFIRMPKLSPTMETGTLTTWCVELNQAVKEDQLLAEIETDKAIMELESLDAGTIGYLKPAGQDFDVNKIIGCILEEGEKAPDNWEEFIALQEGESGSKEESKTEEKEQPSQAEEADQPDQKPEDNNLSRIFASPLAKKIAADKSIDLSLVKGSGPKGRIIKVDVENFKEVKQVNKAKTETVQAGSVEVPLTRMRKVIAERLTQSKQEIPHIYMNRKIKTQVAENMKNSFMANFETKVSLTPIIIKAIGCALKAMPDMNRSWENGKIMQHSNANVSVAVAIEGGLLTPVIFNADEKSISHIASELKELAIKAKEGKLTPAEMQGGTFSLSNLGMFGVESFQAIINPPQAGILAVGSSQVRAVLENGTWVPEKIMEVNLSCDHRVIDGAEAAQFLNFVRKFIENPEGMLL